MSDYQVVPPTEHRCRLFRSSVEAASLDDVVEAVTDAVRFHERVYLERRGDRYRWSLATGGGPYPLLRLICKYLEIPHYWVLVSTAAWDGWTITAPRWDGPVDARAVLHLELGSTAVAVRTAVIDAVG